MTLPSAEQPEPMKGWIIEYGDAWRAMCVVIGTERDAEEKAKTLPGCGHLEPWVSGPYEFSIAVKP